MYEFGPLAAQDDPDLLSYFHTSEQVRGLVASGETYPAFVFVARPGGGKTALVRWLERGEHDRTFLFLRPTETRIEMDGDDSNVEDHRILMAAELFTAIVSEAVKIDSLSEDLRDKGVKYLRDAWWKPVDTFFKERFEGLSIVGTGFSLKPSARRDYLREIRRARKVDAASDLVRQLSTALDLTLVVDNPEFIVGRGLEDVTRGNAVRIGAFISVLNHLHSLGIQVILFAKEHILQSVQEHYRDFSHFEDRIEGLEWTEKDLLSMLDLRISHRLRSSWGRIFSLSQRDFKRLVLPCLINGPRDLLHICNSAGRDREKISKEDLESGIRALRMSKWADIETQYGTQWPAISVFARAITELIVKESGDRPATREQFRELLEKDFSNTDSPLGGLRKQEPWINVALWARQSIEERLFLIGCLGFIRGSQVVYPWAGRSLEGFRLADQIFVSPLFQ